MIVYVLRYEWGEFDDYRKDNIGVFSSVETATMYYNEHVRPDEMKMFHYDVTYWIEPEVLDDPRVDSGETSTVLP